MPACWGGRTPRVPPPPHPCRGPRTSEKAGCHSAADLAQRGSWGTRCSNVTQLLQLTISPHTLETNKQIRNSSAHRQTEPVSTSSGATPLPKACCVKCCFRSGSDSKPIGPVRCRQGCENRSSQTYQLHQQGCSCFPGDPNVSRTVQSDTFWTKHVNRQSTIC